jgi:translation initiation factor IF-3
VGIKPLPEALSIARAAELDLVEIAPMANPPVCRIMDFNKWRYEEAQRAKEARKKAVSHGIKEMKYRPKIGQGDFDTKTRKVAEFLSEGHKVKITIMFRGREVFHPEIGMEILKRIENTVVETAKVEASPKLDGRNMTMVLAPDSTKRKPDKPERSPRPAKDEGNEAATGAIAEPAVEPAAEPAAAPNEPTVEQSA